MCETSSKIEVILRQSHKFRIQPIAPLKKVNITLVYYGAYIVGNGAYGVGNGAYGVRSGAYGAVNGVCVVESGVCDCLS